MKISIIIPSKNNARYLKWSIPSIRKNSYYKNHEIIIFIDQDNDNTLKWIVENKEKYNLKYIINPTSQLFGIGRCYDSCVFYAENDIIMAFHADMWAGKDWDFHSLKYLKENSIVALTRIEPPLHPEQPCKIVKDFGMWPEKNIEQGFKEEELEKFIEEQKIINKDRYTHGIFAPWIINKKTYIEMGGHDYIFHSAREDSDFFNRCKLNGMDIIQSWESFVYHLTQRGGRLEYSLTKNSSDWEELMLRSSREYTRKWQSFIHNDEYMMPIIFPIYNRGLIINGNINENVLQLVEPFFTNIYLEETDENNKTLIKYVGKGGILDSDILEFNDGEWSKQRKREIHEKIRMCNINVINEMTKFNDMCVVMSADDDILSYVSWFGFFDILNQTIKEQNIQKGIYEFGKLKIIINVVRDSSKLLIKNPNPVWLNTETIPPLIY
jgi:glycosyltransferase involved in cell wall biosynthesis